MVCLVPSVRVASAVNCRVAFRASMSPVVAGVTAIEATTGAVTVTVMCPTLEPLAALLVAVMSTVPTATPVTRPRWPAAFETVAVAGVAEAQVTAVVMTWVEPSVNVPVAIRFRVAPLATDGVAGVMATETSVAAVTVRATGALVTVVVPITT